MKHWSYICVEGHCFSDSPCEREIPSAFCLGDGRICPHFVWSDATERDAAYFVPMRLILKDRILAWQESIWQTLSWWFWDCFNQRKTREFFDSIPVVPRDSPVVARWEKEQEINQKRYLKWITGEDKMRDKLHPRKRKPRK